MPFDYVEHSPLTAFRILRMHTSASPYAIYAQRKQHTERGSAWWRYQVNHCLVPPDGDVVLSHILGKGCFSDMRVDYANLMLGHDDETPSGSTWISSPHKDLSLFVRKRKNRSLQIIGVQIRDYFPTAQLDSF